MSHKQSSVVSLTILSKEYKIACDFDEQELLLDRIAVMVALNMAHELQLLQQENERLNQNLNECLSNMRHKIENVLENE